MKLHGASLSASVFQAYPLNTSSSHSGPIVLSEIPSLAGQLWPKAARGRKPHSDKPGGLNGSLQHPLNVFVIGVYKADFVRGRQFKRNKALFRF